MTNAYQICFQGDVDYILISGETVENLYKNIRKKKDEILKLWNESVDVTIDFFVHGKPVCAILEDGDIWY